MIFRLFEVYDEKIPKALKQFVKRFVREIKDLDVDDEKILKIFDAFVKKGIAIAIGYVKKTNAIANRVAVATAFSVFVDLNRLANFMQRTVEILKNVVNENSKGGL